MRIPLVILLLALPGLAERPGPDRAGIRTGLLAAGRGAREEAVDSVRAWARTDPAGAAALFPELDLRGRVLLAEAIASAGTSHAAAVAMKLVAGSPEPEVFGGLLRGLAKGGAKALFTDLPEGFSAERRQAIETLQLRWRVEAELCKLKSESGPTGHYEGQFAGVKELGPKTFPIFFDIVTNRASPLAGEGGGGPYRPIHPAMVRFEPDELRGLGAYAFSEIVDPGDLESIGQLVDLFRKYWGLDEELFPTERTELAPAIAFSLHDLGVKQPAETYIRQLEQLARSGWRDFRARDAQWDLGYAYIRIGEFDKGQYWYQVVLRTSTSTAIAAYNLACNFAMRAEREPARRAQMRRLALDYLERAIREHNYGDWKWMEEDGDLDFIRDDPRYKALLLYLQKKYPERRKGRVSKRHEDFLGDGK